MLKFIDAEEVDVQKAIDDLAIVMMRKFNKSNPVVFNTVQLYRKDRLKYRELLKNNKNKDIQFGLKLVRGAYMEKERKFISKGIESPICN